MPGYGWFVKLLDQLAFGGVRFSPELLLFRKTALMVEGVVSDLLARADDIGSVMDQALISEFLRSWTLEWPARWLSFPDDRSFSTHVSTMDALRLFLSAPSIANRAIFSAGRQLLPKAA